jgi:hypothetical protein
MTHNMLKALPGVAANAYLVTFFVLPKHPFWALILLLVHSYGIISIGANADYWEKRYRTRNWGQGDRRFTPGSTEL